MKVSTSELELTAQRDNERGYDVFLMRVREHFAAVVAAHGPHLFTTDAQKLFDCYLDALPTVDQQHHRCTACHRFMKDFGGLVAIDTQGATIPVMWPVDDVPPYYVAAAARLNASVGVAKVTGVFHTKPAEWGFARTGPWTHFAVSPGMRPARSALHTPSQAMAEKREDFATVVRALQEFPAETVKRALAVLASDTLYRSEKVLGPIQWLYDLLTGCWLLKNPHTRTNLLWRAVAAAPAGFCHPRSSMAGSLLEDINAGLSFDEVSRRFAAKMHPLQYQRPQAAPSQGNIEQAEKIVARLGIARSLERRFARPDEIQAFWRATPLTDETPRAGVFGHLKPKGTGTAVSPSLTVPPVVMTWDKFAKAILPTAQRIEYFVPSGRNDYAALTTAVHADAPPILQWDREEQRNPVASYLWTGGSAPEHWGLPPGRFVAVYALAFKPPHWGGDATQFQHESQAVFLLLENAAETRNEGNALFPETLKSELREVRSTIESYSRSAQLQGFNEPMACGLMLGKNQSWNVRLRVTSALSQQEYRLDRWD